MNPWVIIGIIAIAAVAGLIVILAALRVSGNISEAERRAEDAEKAKEYNANS